jgi:hypothetical protein
MRKKLRDQADRNLHRHREAARCVGAFFFASAHSCAPARF